MHSIHTGQYPTNSSNMVRAVAVNQIRSYSDKVPIWLTAMTAHIIDAFLWGAGVRLLIVNEQMLVDDDRILIRRFPCM